ncbi:serine-type D-Ala-D-Ala carboxypeptidase MrdA, partial [Salmonella enterica]|nr:serine-type D-Ala-D-Ala carboxypeptidase MrdA [Salmonella enterica]
MTFKDFDAEEKLFLRRVIVAFGVVVVCFGILIFNLYNLQIRQHHYYTTRSNENDIKMLPVAPTRGIIYDRNGIPLVRNVTWYDIAVTPYKIADMDALLKQLTPIVDLSPDDIADFRRALKSSSRYRPVVLKNALTDVEIARFAVNQFHFNGVTINSYQDRQYPYGAELAHVLGY